MRSSTPTRSSPLQRRNAMVGGSRGEGGPRAIDREAEWGTHWRWPRQVASIDEVGRSSEDDAKGGWGLE
jgi:hypothetical protein